MAAYYEGLLNIIPGDRVIEDAELSRYTTFRIGGPADRMVFPVNEEELSGVMDLCRSRDIPFYILGNGSNVLASDAGYRGMIINMKAWTGDTDTEENADSVKVTYSAGISLIRMANEVADMGLAGFEFAGGIPGTLGGAIVMNAGAYGGDISESIISATVMNRQGQIYNISRDGLQLGYRTSCIAEKEYIVLSGTFCFKRGNAMEIKNRINELNGMRREKQPLEYPSAGSTFKRPVNRFAGELIMKAGLRGMRVGDAMVSEKHCGFIINAGQATAGQVHELIHRVVERVNQEFGVVLESEVRFLG